MEPANCNRISMCVCVRVNLAYGIKCSFVFIDDVVVVGVCVCFISTLHSISYIRWAKIFAPKFDACIVLHIYKGKLDTFTIFPVCHPKFISLLNVSTNRKQKSL